VPVPERIPLTQSHDRGQRVVLQQENAPWGYPRCTVSHCQRLIRIVHHAEGVDDQIG
jgi:hypothetical protein